MPVRVRGCVVPGAAPPGAVMDQLGRLGIESAHLSSTDALARALDDVAGQLDGSRLLVASGDLVVADEALRQLLDDPGTGSRLLLATDRSAGHPVRVVHRRLVSAGSEHHDVTAPTGSSLGALLISEADAAAAAGALQDMARVARTHDWHGDAVDHAVVSLVRSEVQLTALPCLGPAVRSGAAEDRDRVQHDLAGLDRARLLLEHANRADDGFYSTFVLRRLSKPLTRLALRLGLSPNQITLTSLVVGLAAAALFWAGSAWSVALGAVLLQLSLVIDCVDGEVARYTRRFSDLGAWLDASTDRVKEYSVYAGLAAGAGTDGVWLLAAVAMTLQTVRHMGDYDYDRVHRVRDSWVPRLDLGVRSDGATAGPSDAALQLSDRVSGRSFGRWAKKVVHMPIGERWLLISVLAVAAGPRWVLVGLLVMGLVALGYTTAGRVLRCRRWHHPVEQSGHWLLDPQTDLGPLAHGLEPRARRLHTMPFGWALPSALRLLEMGLVLLVAVVALPHHPALAFGWLFVVSFHHYDTLYRALGGSSPPRWLTWAGLGLEGRTLVVLVTAAAGATALRVTLATGSAALAVLLVGVASAQWVLQLRGLRES